MAGDRKKIFNDVRGYSMNNISLSNYFFSKSLIDHFINLGVRYACVSPGSRNTPLMLALSDQNKIESISVVDERDSGFIALGLAKSRYVPTLVITTSGTATANLYPSIIEAFMKLNYDAGDAVAEIQAKVASQRNVLPKEANDPVIDVQTGRRLALMYLAI